MANPKTAQTRPNSLEGLDSEEVAEHCRAWKAIDWDVTDLLYQKGWIADPRAPVVIS
jgi:hypothetical protein